MNIVEIVEKRKPPGILLLDKKGNIVSFNEQVLKIIPNFSKLPSVIKRLYNSAIKSITTSKEEKLVALLNKQKEIYSLRALILKDNNNNKNFYIMILIEEIAEKPIDFSKVKEKFKLTVREIQVLKLICDGFSNKKISDILYISEYTVKDHIKNIMKKLNVVSRNEIIALLLRNRT